MEAAPALTCSKKGSPSLTNSFGLRLGGSDCQKSSEIKGGSVDRGVSDILFSATDSSETGRGYFLAKSSLNNSNSSSLRPSGGTTYDHLEE